MKFGQSADEAANDTRGSGSAYMKYFKDGDTVIRLLDEPSAWLYWWDHFDPSGFSYPCTNERDTCPGCTSPSEKVKRASRKISFHVLEGDFINVYKVPPVLADKFKLRFERTGTVTDRDYMVTRYKTGSGDKKKTEYDLEASPPDHKDLSKYELQDMEEMLAQQYDEIWGDSKKVAATKRKQAEAEQEAVLKDKVESQEKGQPEDPPSEPSTDRAPVEGEYTEHYLRSLGFPTLVALLVKEGKPVPDTVSNTDELVDWIIANQ